MPAVAFGLGLALGAAAGGTAALLRRRAGRAVQAEPAPAADPRPALEHAGQGIAELRGRQLQWANPRWAEILGARPEHLAGADLSAFCQDPGTFEALHREAAAALDLGRRFAGDFRMRQVDGTPFWAHLVAVRLPPGSGREGDIWCLDDYSQRVEAQEDLADALTLQQKLIASSPSGILLFRGKDGACLLANEAALRILGIAPEERGRINFRRAPAWASCGFLAAAEEALAGGLERSLEATVAIGPEREATLACTFSPFESRGEPLLLAQVSDISARVSSERERDRLLAELEQKNKELETLIYVASHDLRSPLVNIQGFSQRLGRSLEQLEQLLEAGGSAAELRAAAGPLLRERMPAALEYIRASGAKMDAIINGLLRLSRAGRMMLRAEALDMGRLLGSVLAAMAFQIQEAEGEVVLEELAGCRADPVQVAQVFSNLLDNAVKYRRPGQPPRIRVSAQARAGQSVYCVEDDGIGIPLEHRGRIFDIFQRLDPQGATRGDGLGLTLVRRMVERNGGQVWMESAPEGGSRFYVALPAV
jgi:signal transduction histidine kinase